MQAVSLSFIAAPVRCIRNGANASIRYPLDEHLFNLRMNYIQDDSALVKVDAAPTAW